MERSTGIDQKELIEKFQRLQSLVQECLNKERVRQGAKDENSYSGVSLNWQEQKDDTTERSWRIFEDEDGRVNLQITQDETEPLIYITYASEESNLTPTDDILNQLELKSAELQGKIDGGVARDNLS